MSQVEKKIQTLHGLRLQRKQIDDQITALESSLLGEINALDISFRGKRKRVKAVHIETPTVEREQDLDSWRRRLADVEGL